MIKRVVLLTISIVCITFFSFANPVLEKRISIHVEKQSLQKVFSAIEMQVNITFAFQSNVLDPNRLVSLHATNEQLGTVIKKLLDPLQLSFFAVDNQIIIFRPKKENANKKNVYTDTVLMVVYDTITVKDTNLITIYDTTTVYDTIKVKPPKTPKKPKKEYNQYFAFRYSLMFGNYNDPDPVNTKSEVFSKKQNVIISNEFALTIGKLSRNWTMETGIGFKNMQQTVDYNIYHYKDVSYTRIDSTLDISRDTLGYFTIPGVDTTWNILVDTSYLKDTVNYSVTESSTEDRYYSNSIKYITIPVSLGFRKSINQNVCFISMLSLNTSILVNADGYMLNSGKNPSIVSFAHSYLSPVVFSGTLTLGLELTLQKYFKLDLLPCISYQFTPITSSPDFDSMKALEYGLSIRLKKYF